MDYPIKTLGQLRPILQGFRKAASLTQAAMASHLGVTQQTYAQLEANPAAVSVERLFKVLRVLQVDLQLTQNAGEAAKNLVDREPAVPPVAPATTRKAPVRPAKETAATTGDVKPNTPSKRNRHTAAETQTRAKKPAKPSARITVRQIAGNKASKAPRAAAKPQRASKKRENW